MRTGLLCLFAVAGIAFAQPQKPNVKTQAEAMKKLAEEEFKRRDANGDGFLNKDEMPDALKTDRLTRAVVAATGAGG